MRSRAHDELQARAIFDTAVQGIITIDGQGVVLRFNRAAERIFGYEAAEVVGRKVTMLMPDPVRERHDGYLAAYLKDRWPQVIGNVREVVGLRRDGRTVPLEIAVSEVSLDGRTFFTGILHDISQRKRFEKALEESEKTARALLNAIQESALLLDIEGRVLAINQTAAQRLGLPAEDLENLIIHDLLPPEVAAQRRLRLAEVARLKKPVRFEDKRQGRHFDNTIYPVFDEDGRVARVAVFANDVTERWRTEEELRKSEASIEEAQRIAHLGNWTWDLATNEVSWSDAMFRLLEVNPEGLGRTYEAFLALVHPEDRDLVRQSPGPGHF